MSNPLQSALRAFAPLVLFVAVVAFAESSTRAAEYKPIPRRIPPKGVAIPQAERDAVAAALKALQGRIDAAVDEEGQTRLPDATRAWLPDVTVIEKAVRFALDHGEFYRKTDPKLALDLIKLANERLNALENGKAPWLKAKGFIVRGYQSSVDGSPQPYGIEVPAMFDVAGKQKPRPLYVWLHGRGDKVTDLHFIQQRRTKGSPISKHVGDAIVLHPFGRQCIGWKHAGEIDVLEAIDHVKQQYAIDENRIVLMGFSMGGAGAWHIGAHYTDRFVAVSAGAGFAETAQYIRLKKEDYPAWYEQTLWGVYDTPGYVRNHFNLPVVAYSGEKDKQIQAARVMEAAYKQHGKTLPHLIGPGMGHKYHPDTLNEIMKRMHAAMKQGRDALPKSVSLQTQTLRYPRMHWVKATGLIEHWRDSRIDATWDANAKAVTATTKNISALKIDLKRSLAGWRVTIDGQQLAYPQREKRLSTAPRSFVRVDGKWQHGVMASPIRKSPGLQGPIDDGFLRPFLVVRPTGEFEHPAVEKWVKFQLAHFEKRWRELFRGELRIKDDRDVSVDDVKQYNLVLWGEPTSNAILGAVASKLPLKWGSTKLSVQTPGGHTRGGGNAATHVPVMIFPKAAIADERRGLRPPLPGYIIVNSGPTFREGHDRTNSLQNPKLPDWAIIDITTPPSDTAPGRVVDAGFFDEQWRVKAKR